MLSANHILKWVNHRYFPFYLAAVLFLVMLFILLVGMAWVSPGDSFFLAGGMELLLYLLANGICSLSVQHFEPYVKQTLAAYLLNLALLVLIGSMVFRGVPADFNLMWPVYLALTVSFFLSIGLVVLIRQILTILRQK